MSELRDLKSREAEELYFFPKGLPGFEETRYFRLIAEGTAVAQLIAVSDENIGFIVLRPEAVDPGYEFEIDQESEHILRGSAQGDSELKLEVWLVLTLNRQEIQQSTVNLKAPLILNLEEKVGVQFILDDEHYSSRQPLMLKQRAQEGVEL